MPSAVDSSDFLLKARVMSALGLRGLEPDAQAFVWRGVEQRLSERGVDIQTDLAKVVMEMLTGQ